MTAHDRHQDPTSSPPGIPSQHRSPDPPPAGPTAADQPPELAVLVLLSQSRAPLRSLFRSHHIPPEDAEDLLQEALLIVIKRWPSIGLPPAFLVGTVKHLVQLHLQRRRGERAALHELARRQALDAGDVPQRRDECRHDARRLLSRLPEASRRIVALRHGAGISSRDVARHLARTETGVRQTASRGLRRLRRDAKAIQSPR